jgi:hypothetical protein
LPKWFAIPPGLVRSDVSIEMSYYVKPWGRTATFLLKDTKNRTVQKAQGKLSCVEPFHLKNPPTGFPSGYPSYERITVDGTTEMIEHRRMEPVIYITDDPAVWKGYATAGCR